MTENSPEKSLVPAFDNLPSSKSEDKWLSTINTAVKLSTILQCTLALRQSTTQLKFTF